MKNKTILTLLLVLGAFPLLAQVNSAGKQPLQTQVENTVLRAQAQQQLIEPTEDDPYLLIRAEELWQADRNIHSGYPKHDLKYYYNWLLQQEKAKAKPAQPADIGTKKGTAHPAPAAETEELSLQEQIAAETELAHIRNTWDMNATFEKYPYLLSPSYRRATEEGKRSIRRQYTNPSWARSVGL